MAAMSQKLIDLSHEVEQGMITYKGLPAPIICDYLSREDSKKFYESGTEFQIGKIEMISNTGTYVDCPFHRYADFKNGIEVGQRLFEGLALKGKAVLVNTNWSKHWRTDAYFENHPFLTEEAAVFLRDQGVKLVGIDSHNI